MLKWAVSVDPTKHRDVTLTRGSSPKHVTASGVERLFPSVGGPFGSTRVVVGGGGGGRGEYEVCSSC